MAFILFGVLFVVLILGVPIGISMGMGVLAALTFGGTRVPSTIIVQRMFTALDNFPFMAVPFFILAGDLMQQGGISKRLLRFIHLICRRIPARLAIITTIASGFFGAISGSNPATVAAIGGIMIPEMKEVGYPEDSSAAVAAASGTLGVIIPPSISMITYSLVASVSISTMFIAGIMPGLLLALTIIVVSLILCGRYERGVQGKVSSKEILAAFFDAIWALLMPVIILGGIYGGIFTPTEAAAVACVYSFIISVYVYRDISYSDLPAIFTKSGISTAIVLFIVAVSSSFSWLMTSAGVPGQITRYLLTSFSSKYTLFLMMNLSLLFLGCFLETQSIILLMTPILLPLCVQLGMHPVALGLIIVVNTSIGMITPFMAVNLYVASSIAGVGIERITIKILPYLFALIAVLIFVTYFPQALMWIPTLVGAQ